MDGKTGFMDRCSTRPKECDQKGGVVFARKWAAMLGPDRELVAAQRMIVSTSPPDPSALPL